VDILDDMGVSKLTAKVFFLKVNYSFKAMQIAVPFVSVILSLVIDAADLDL